MITPDRPLSRGVQEWDPNSVWENEMGREIGGSDASKTRPSLSAPESHLSAQNLF